MRRGHATSIDSEILNLAKELSLNYIALFYASDMSCVSSHRVSMPLGANPDLVPEQDPRPNPLGGQSNLKCVPQIDTA